MRAGARTGYFIPARDGIGGLDLDKNSYAVVAVAAAVVAVPKEGSRVTNKRFRCTGVILHADRKSNGRDRKSNGRDGKSNGRDGKSNGRDM